MKDTSQQTLEKERPHQVTTLQAVNFCLEQLYADNERNVTDKVAGKLTFEELIGALLLAKDDVLAYTLQE